MNPICKAIVQIQIYREVLELHWSLKSLIRNVFLYFSTEQFSNSLSYGIKSKINTYYHYFYGRGLHHSQPESSLL